MLFTADLLLNRLDGQRLVIIVDQFEELWTFEPVGDEQRKQFIIQQQHPFIDLLVTAATTPDTPVLIIIAMRADFLHRAAEHPALARLIGDHDVIVSPMSRVELREAIHRPAELAGGSFEAGLVEELIAQVEGREGVLPLLEYYTLRALWQTDGGAMTWASYRALGGVEGALAARADSILSEHYTPEQRDELRHILPRLVQPGEGAADTRRVPLAELVPAGESLEQMQALLQPLVNERLLVTNTADKETGREGDKQRQTVEVAHEALIRAWPTLRDWVQESRDDLRFQIQLSEMAQEWERNERNSDLLWRGFRLGQAEEWLARQATPERA